MKKIEAIIKPFKLEEVKAALEAIGIQSMTVVEIRARGCEKGRTETFHGGDYVMEFLHKMQVNLLVEDWQAESAAEAIIAAATTGKIGDGRVVISSVEEIIAIGRDAEGDGLKRTTPFHQRPIANAAA
jgi:nitrogen regulatory protein P-II 1